jgi:hypothetical protein
MHDHEAKSDDANGHTALDESPIHIDLRARDMDEATDPCTARFHFFVIDTAWNGPVSKAVRAHLPLMARFMKEDPLFVLTPEMSVEVLRQAPELIGHDPMILVYDLVKPPGRARTYHGFRLNLGLMRNPEQALARFQEFVRFLSCHRCNLDLDLAIRHQLHKQGFQGMVKILREATNELL